MGICFGSFEHKTHHHKVAPGNNAKQANSNSRCGDIGLVRSLSDVAFSSDLKSFTSNDLKNATKSFSADTLIGEGGFGYVFKGWINENTLAPAKTGTGTVVAVKKLKAQSFQGHREWLVCRDFLYILILPRRLRSLSISDLDCSCMQTEVKYLGQLRHENLVKLIGYCSESKNRMLVYEFMPKGSLENHLFKSTTSFSS